MALETFGDLALPQLNMLLGTLALPLPVPLSRATVMQSLTQHNALWVEAFNMTLMPAPTLRTWCTALGLSEQGQRRSMVNRLVNSANGFDAAVNPPAPAIPVVVPPVVDPNLVRLDNPRDLEFSPLVDALDKTKVDMWLRELAGVANERGFSAQWTTIISGTDQEYNDLFPMNDRLDQFVLMMRRALYKSLDASITVQLDPAINDGTVQDNCRAIISYVRNKGEELRPALIEGSNEKLTKAKWGGSKVSLAAWVGKLRTIAGTCGDQLPAGVPRENAIRKLVMSNVGMRNPDCAQVISSFQVKPVSQAGFTVDELVVQLTTVMIKSETGGERQCQVFAADIQDEKALHALLAQKDNTISQLKNSNANKRRGGRQRSKERRRNSILYFRKNRGQRGPIKWWWWR